MSVGGKLKLPARYRVLMLTFLVILASYATIYTVAAYRVASMWALGGCSASWRGKGSLGGPTFFPFPTGSQGVVMEIIAKMNPMDGFIYLYLVKNGILIVVCVLLWVLAAVYFFKAILPLFRKELERYVET